MTVFLCLLGVAWTGGWSLTLLPMLLRQIDAGATGAAMLSGVLLALQAVYMWVFARRLYLYLRAPHRAALRASWSDTRSRMLHRARYVMWLDRRGGRL